MRNTLRVALVLWLLSLAVVVPFISSGYSELKRAAASNSYNEAAQHYEIAARRIPWRADLYELAGHEYYRAKEYTQADAAYQNAMNHNMLSADGWVAWGDVNYLNNDSKRAAEIWQQGLAQKNFSENLYSRLAEIYQEQGDYAKAAEYLQNYVSVHSKDASAHYRLGLLLTLSDPNRALSELISASQLDPQIDPAVQTLRTALNIASLNEAPSERFVIIGRGLGLVEEWQLARAAFESATRADEKNAEAWAWLGEANQHTGVNRSDELDTALSLNPNSATVRGLRGLYFQRAGNFRQALTEFQAAATLDANNPAWMVSIGESYSKLGDLIRALQAYQYATTLAPEDAKYWRLLAIFCAQNNVNIKDVGIPAAQRAVALAKDDLASLDVLGWTYLLDARYTDAEKMLNRALELDSQNPSVHLHLGMLYLQKGDRFSAYSHLIQARDKGSDKAVHENATAILNQYFP